MTHFDDNIVINLGLVSNRTAERVGSDYATNRKRTERISRAAYQWALSEDVMRVFEKAREFHDLTVNRGPFLSVKRGAHAAAKKPRAF